MYKHDIEVDGETITIERGDVFHVDDTIDFGDGTTLEPGDVVTVATILKQPNGIHFEFSVDGEPGRIETIMMFALEENIEQGYMSIE